MAPLLRNPTSTLPLTTYPSLDPIQSRSNPYLIPAPHPDPEQVWSLFVQMCLGVQSLHDRSILHRDLKVLHVCTACAIYIAALVYIPHLYMCSYRGGLHDGCNPA